MAIEDAIEECKLFYYVGQETTANWLTGRHEKARQEIAQILGKAEPDVEILNRLKIVSTDLSNN